jgi:hypothetical protein
MSLCSTITKSRLGIGSIATALAVPARWKFPLPFYFSFIFIPSSVCPAIRLDLTDD